MTLMPATQRPLAVVVLAAGKGKRMKSARSKVLHRLAGRPLIQHVLALLAELKPQETVVVVGPGMPEVEAAVAPQRCVVQENQKGTGEAVQVTRAALADFARPGHDVLVAFGDTPLFRPETLAAMVAARDAEPRPDLVVMGFRAADPSGYGRILQDDSGAPRAIVEHKDAGPEERAIDLCNAGLMLVDGGRLFDWLGQLAPNNAQGEYYLTDLAGLAVRDGAGTALVEAPEEEVMGVDSRADLAVAEAVIQTRLRAAAMAGGATLVDPTTVWLSADTRLGRDVTIQPSVFIGPGVTIADEVEIRSFCHLEGVAIESGAIVGPFARLRPGAVIGPEVHIGNFVEVKKATLERGAKANHLAYIGDAKVGAGTNVGAGTIFCNYDGYAKHHCEVGPGVFIGSNAALVAPVTVGAGALIAAGSTVTGDVPADALAIARGKQTNIRDGAGRYRATRQPAKKAKEG